MNIYINMTMISLFFLLAGVYSWSPGTQKKNYKIPFPVSWEGQQIQTTFVLDANWRWIHNKEGYANCYGESGWVSQYCSDVLGCLNNCVVEGVEQEEYKSIYGVDVQGGALSIGYVTRGPYSENYGARMYLLDSSGLKYQNFNLKNKQLSYTLDLSEIPCGVNFAVYLAEMPLDGGSVAGAAYGTGYGDGQCPKDIKYLPKFVNLNQSGACSNEFDLSESNSRSFQGITPHTCSIKVVTPCSGDKDCGENADRYSGWCDKDGMGWNPYRFGNNSFYGKGSGFKIDTSKPFDAIFRFNTKNADVQSDLVSIDQILAQGGKEHFVRRLTDKSADDQQKLFGEVNNDFKRFGGMKTMGQVFDRNSFVFIASLWDDSSPSQMQWLDGKLSDEVGGTRGPCTTEPRDPATLRKLYPAIKGKISNIKVVSLKPPSPSPVPSPLPSPLPSPVPSPLPSPSPSPSPSPKPTGVWICDECRPVQCPA